MKFQILRRAGALVLALVLALTLSLSLAAPAWAAEDNPSGTSEPDKTDPPPDEDDGGPIALSFANTSLVDPTYLTVTVNPSDADLSKGTFKWTITPDGKNMVAPSFSGGTLAEDGTCTTTGRMVSLVYNNRTNVGEYTVKVAYTEGGKTVAEASASVTISGILLSGTTMVDEATGAWYMYAGGTAALSVTAYGAANSSAKVTWMSSDGAVLSVMNGAITTFGLGRAVVTAIKGDYRAECTVEVREDESVIADNYGDGYTASVSIPLELSRVYPELNNISEKIKQIGPLTYINNLRVQTSQGTLYYNYVSEGDTGDGVGTSDAFSDAAKGAIKSIDKLYFVPKPGVVGTVDITFNGVSGNGNFTGTIRVNVGMGSSGGGGEDDGDTYQISYGTRAGEPAWFMASDFNSFCQSKTGRSFSSVTFSMPKPNEGVLYYNYMAGTGIPVTTTTRFTQSGIYTLDNVCFVPNAAFTGKSVTINFRAVDSSGYTASGKVEIAVTPVDVSSVKSNVIVYGEKGRPLTLQSELFNDACQATIYDTLSFVIFKLPDPKEGELYYNYQSDGSYESRVISTTRCYYSGVPGLSGVTFVPGDSASDRVAIPYTGYGSMGTSFSGTLYISLDEVNSSTIRYSVEKNGLVTFRASDFYNAGLYQKGVGVSYVEFDGFDDDLGTLRYNYLSDSKPGSLASGSYYVSPNSRQDGLNLVSFRAAGKTGTVTIGYTAYDSSNKWLFDGKVVIQVGAIAAADANFSCNTGRQAGLSSYSLNSACSPVMGVSMSYIEITSVPAPEEGHLYLNYNGFGTGTAVKPGDRFYRAGSPSIDRLTFVPRAGFTGVAEITYIGYSDDGSKQASGKVKVSVFQSTSSWYFNDMGGHTWAIDSVDYLYQNGTVEGLGDGRYNPSETIIKGDFTLMLVRAYGLTASGTASFYDVPPDSYYADAIRIAALLGIAGGSDGYYNPQTALSRQDAMLMIFNALKASGRTVTNGLAADLSIFRDEGDIAPYAKEAVGCLVQMGVVEGVGNGYLLPLNQLSRAETAKLLHSIMTL